MFNRFVNLLQMRRSTAFLLTRVDDRLLDDIGLSRSDLQALHLGLGDARARHNALDFRGFPPGRALPVAG